MAFFNALCRAWDAPIPAVAGPVELYRPTGDGTENLPPGANHEVEFYGEYETLQDAVDAVDCCGRWLYSTPDSGKYLGRLDSVPDGVVVESF